MPNPELDTLTEIAKPLGGGGVGALITYVLTYFKNVKPLEDKIAKIEVMLQENEKHDAARTTEIELLKAASERSKSDHMELKDLIKALSDKMDAKFEKLIDKIR